MPATDTFERHATSVRRFIEAQTPALSPSTSDGPSAQAAEQTFNELALGLFRLQFEHVPPYRRFCESLRRVPGQVARWTEIPSVPTRAFQELEFSSLPEAERTTVFHSSGTTAHRPSRHFHNAASLALYEASLWPWFRAHLLADLDNGGVGDKVTAGGPTLACASEIDGIRMSPVARTSIRVLFLSPPPTRVPHSSLVHMFEVIRRRLEGAEPCYVGEVARTGAWVLDFERVKSLLASACAQRHPLALLGTAFSFVHLLDRLTEGNLRFGLPPGSRVMETGGYKGRSRGLAQTELHALITDRLAIPASHIVGEYGMSELSSQAYDRAITASGWGRVGRGGANVQRCYHFPPWARGQVVSPETDREVADGKMGLMRIVDLANTRSVLAVQTDDVGRRHGLGFELIGRAAPSEPRGCSLLAAP